MLWRCARVKWAKISSAGMVCVRGCWKVLWRPRPMKVLATKPPTGFGWAKPKVADATGSTTPPRASRTFISMRWSRGCGIELGLSPPTVSALSAESGLDGPSWAEHEFGDCELGDERLTRRLVKIARDQAAQPNGSYAQAAGVHRHALKGYYRLLNHESPELDPQKLLQSHRARTLRRMSQERTALIVQDSTDLNYSTRSRCRGLGVGSDWNQPDWRQKPGIALAQFFGLEPERTAPGDRATARRRSGIGPGQRSSAAH